MITAEVSIANRLNKHAAPIIPNYPTDLMTYSSVDREDPLIRDFAKSASLVNLFERFVSPMLMLQTIFTSIVSPDPYHRNLLPVDTNIMELVHLLIKCGKFNKNALRYTKMETVHQTVHSNPVLMGLYQDIIKKMSQLNQAMEKVQFDVNLQLFPQHGLQVFAVRLVHTIEKLVPRSEAESLNEHLTTSFKKRTATLNRNSSFRKNNNDDGPHRKRRRF